MILCITAQVITVLNGVIHCLLGYLLSFRELPAKVNKARGAMIHWESIIEESTLKNIGLITLVNNLTMSSADVQMLPTLPSTPYTGTRQGFRGAEYEFSIHLVVYYEELAIPKQTTTGKGILNSLMAGSLPKTTKPTYLDVAVLLRRYVADKSG
ncbi:hypothetical protein Tco_0105376 [Tanacetum coccineum]